MGASCCEKLNVGSLKGRSATELSVKFDERYVGQTIGQSEQFQDINESDSSLTC